MLIIFHFHKLPATGKIPILKYLTKEETCVFQILTLLNKMTGIKTRHFVKQCENSNELLYTK